MDITATAGVTVTTSSASMLIYINLATSSDVVIALSAIDFIVASAMAASCVVDSITSQVELNIPVELLALCAIVVTLRNVNLSSDLLSTIDYPGYNFMSIKRKYNTNIA